MNISKLIMKAPFVSALSAFTSHPNSVGESYFQHLFTALSFAIKMLVGSMACFIHAVFPFMCTKTGSQAITELHDKMVEHRNKANAG